MPAAFPPAIVCQAAAPAPADREAIYSRAVSERLSGATAAAIADLETLLTREPGDVDARLQLGFALRAAGRSADAEAAFREVLQRAPAYKDARVALAQLLWARGDAAGAKSVLGDALMRDPGDADTKALVARINGPGAPTLWRIDESLAYSALSRGLPEWWENDISLSRKVDAQSAVTATVQALRRFDINETYVEGAYDRGWALGEWSVAAGGSLDPTFRPKFQLRSDLTLIPQAGSAWRLVGDASFARYVAGDVENVSVGADRMFLGDAGRIGARFIGTHDETGHYLPGFSTLAGWRFNDRVDAQASYTDAADTETGMTTRVRAVALGANLTLTDRAILHATVTNEAREHSYDRVEVALGATAKF